MPLYEYKCDNEECALFGELQMIPKPVEDRDKAKCEKCKNKLRRLVSRTNFTVK
jgi:putative FmdB family regulatory protein